METTKHTPGPWTFTAYGEGRPTPEFDVVYIESDGKPIAKIDTDFRRQSEARANAKLIAAAPDLFEALEKLAFVDPKDREASKAALKKAFEAIRKATE